MRTLFLVLAFYIAALALVDSVTFNGHYRNAIWQEANHRAARGYAEVRYLLEKIGI